MAEMLCSALVQETVSRGVSFGLSRREEKASQGHLMERLQMAANELEFAVERAQELPILHLSLLSLRNQYKAAYVKAMELLDKHMQQAVPTGAGQELQVAQGVKRKRWVICAKNMSLNPFVSLSTDDVRRFEWYADHAGRFLRDLESGCSLHHYNFCSPIVRHLLEGKSLRYCLKQGNLLRDFYLWPVYSDKRGMEAVLEYHYKDSRMLGKCFCLVLSLRLSESTDIVQVATKCLQYLTSQFSLPAESAMRELTLLYNLQDIVQFYGPPWVGIQELHIDVTQLVRPDPACCRGIRHGLCANSYVSSELSDIFPEQVILFCFEFYIPALEPSSSYSSFHDVGRSKSRGGGKPPLLLRACFFPHEKASVLQHSYARERIGDVSEYRDATIQQAAETLKLNASNCFLYQPGLKEYKIDCYSRHGGAWFTVEKANTETAGVPKTRRKYNTRGVTRRSSRR